MKREKKVKNKILKDESENESQKERLSLREEEERKALTKRKRDS